MSQVEVNSAYSEDANTNHNWKNRDFWINKFSGELVRTTFHYDYKESVSNVRIIDNVDFRFSGEIFSNLIDECKGSDLKLFEILTTGLVALISRNIFTQDGFKDISIGAPVLYQQRRGIELKPVNTILALRIKFEEKVAFWDLAKKVGMAIQEAQEHKDFSIEDIPKLLDMQIYGDDFPLFDVAVSLENIQDRRYIRHMNVNIVFSFFKTGKYIDGVVEYNSSLYERSTIKKIIAHYTNFIRLVLFKANRKKGVADINFLTQEEKRLLLYEFNGGLVDYPKEKVISELIEMQVNKTPGRIALVFGNTQMTYRELNRRSNRVAWILREKGIIVDSIVPMMVERSIDAIVAIVGIIKSGAGYLPILVDNPLDRIRNILNDSSAKIIVTQKKYENLSEGHKDVVYIEDRDLYTGIDTNPPIVNTREDLMYVIYTSGSTGKPKGVMLNHENFINLMFFQNHETDINFQGCILQFASIGFDVSVQEIFSSLLFGGTLYLTSNELKHDAPRLFKYIQNNYVEILFMPPAFLKFVFSDSGIAEKFPSCIKHIIAAGEQLIVTEGFEKYLKKYGVFLHNHYGPTESHVVTTLTLAPQHEIPEAPSIGKPITNNNILILGRDSNALQPLGVPGELYITGVNVARGYSNRPELSHERFSQNPYINKERMYRTGDLARRLADGNVDYLGRIDFQVKIRGFRIEIGEIESQLLKFEDTKLKEVVVLAKEESKGADKYLCAYIVSDDKVDINKLNQLLSKNLPDYMIPSYFIQVDKIPLTSNGKVDRRALPDPKSLGRQESYIAPRNEIEKSLVNIWSEVLHIDKKNISITDNFFKLGGHSLKAALIIATIHKLLNVRMSIYDIFEMPTIMELAKYIGGVEEEEYSSIELAELKEYYIQTSSQKRLYFIDQLEKESILYNIQLMDIYCKGVNHENLELAFKALIRRHESLRTSFQTIEGNAVQRIHDSDSIESDFNIEFYETTEEGLIYITDSATDKKGVPFMEVVEGFVRPFDLRQAPLLRAGLIKIWGNTQILMMDMHHIISDGISLEVLLTDLWALYDERDISQLKIQYKDFSEWLTNDKQKSIIKQQEKYWLQEFSGEIPVLNLPTDFPRPAKMNFDGDSIYFEIGKEDTKKLNSIAQKQNATLYMVILTIYNILLAKLSGQEEIIVGTVSAGRSHADLHDLIGMFVETLAIRNHPTGAKTFKEFLGEVKKKTLAAFTNQSYPFEQLVSKVSARQDKSRNPLFDVVFSYENEAERSDDYLLDVLMLDKSNPYNFKIKKAKFDMTLIGAETGEEIQFTIEYNTQLFKAETIERFVVYIKKIVASVCNSIEQSICDIDIMPDLERGILLYAFNDTDSEYPKRKTINELFEEQVEKFPNNLAVYGKSLLKDTDSKAECTTYKELNVKSNQIAHLLRVKGVKSDHIVSIMVESSLEMMVGLVGILKAGGAFLPIKDGTPRERTEYILHESNTHFLLTASQLLGDFNFNGEVIQLDKPNIYEGDQAEIHNVNKPSDLAYVIYTSGSTGKPKGVMLVHRSLINLCYWHNDYYSVTSNDRASKYAGFGFDASVWEIFPYLLIGAAIYIVPEDIKLDIHSLNQYFQDNGITIAFLPTQLCEQFMTIENTTLRVLLTGGDKLKTFVQKNYQLYNNYGPTENTVVSTSYPVSAFISNIPIGKPLYNNQIYIMDKNDNLQPIGVPGELCISGESLARGYLNNPNLTSEKFTESPLMHLTPWVKYPRVYRTGDLARWIWDGNIEFLGRIDYQVKIRGFRIELGEIENQLLRIDDINEAVVITREDNAGQKYLCGYLVSNKKIDISSLRTSLAKKIPEYMVPSFLMQIDSIPLTANGKIDNKSLPAPEIKSIQYKAPTNETEELLEKTWKEVLGVKKIGIDDNFFEIGGDSIKTILISGRLLKQKLSTDVNDFFLYPTIRQLAKHIKKIDRIIDQRPTKGLVELTPILAWFFKRKFEEKHHFNHFVIWYSKDGFNETLVKKTFTKIVEHHDALRMIYDVDKNSGLVKQVNRPLKQGELFHLDVNELNNNKNPQDEIKRELERINREIDLSTGPLVKLGLFRASEGDYLAVIIHHTVVDGVSWRILAEDFETGYTQAEKGVEIKFQDKTDSFKDWALKLKKYADSSEALKELPFWTNIEKTAIQGLPKDNEIDEERKILQNREILVITIDKDDTEKLKKEVNFAYNTEINDILLTALAMTVYQWCGNDKVSVNLEGHGRERIIEDIDISRTIGWFTSQYPVILNVGMDRDEVVPHEDVLGNTIMQVKENLRRIPNKGIGHGILKYMTAKEMKKDIEFKIKPEISFNYLGYLGENEEFKDKKRNIHTNFEPSMSPNFDMDYLFDIYGHMGPNGLIMYFSYNKYQYKKESAEAFSAIYKKNLLRIIEHCTEKKRKISALGLNAKEFHINKESDIYLKRVKGEKWPDLTIDNDYHSILLTGGTGFLGTHLAAELLRDTRATIYLPVRGDSQNRAQERFEKRMSFYLGDDFLDKYNDRIVVLNADLSGKQWGIQTSLFKEMCDTVEVVVHPAANVKHHGLYEELYKDNVLATENLLEFAITGKNKDFHYVSTLDVGIGNIPGKEYTLYTEYCHDLGQEIDHIYLKSKFEAEKRVLLYREKGLNGSIHRVGNLIFQSETGQFQENIYDDYFYAILRGVIKLEMISTDMNEIVFDMSFIDYTAKAISLLLRKKFLKNETYHLCNPHQLSMVQMVHFLREMGYNFEDLSQDEVETFFSKFEGNSEYEKIIELMKLHSWIFEKREGTETIFKLDRTVMLLRELGFEWPIINKQHIEKMIAYCKEVGFL